MRQITDHIVSGDQAHQLRIDATDEPGPGGANHRYIITGYDSIENTSRMHGDNFYSTTILFQKGPIKEEGVNGQTNEALIAIVIDRMRCFQAGPFACEDNQHALDNLEAALCWLQQRTLKRIARNVEGTHQV